MDPTNFIIQLQKQNARSLFIHNEEAIRRYIIRKELFLIIRDDNHDDVGFLTHSRMRPNAATYLWNICIAKGARRHGHGRRLLELLIDRVTTTHGTGLVTVCPDHLAAETFFTHMGFHQTAQQRVVPGHQRRLNHYFMAIKPNPGPQDAPRSQPCPWTGYRRMMSVEALRRFHGLPGDQRMEPL